MINFNLPPYVGTEMEYVREPVLSTARFVVMVHLLRSAANGSKSVLIPIKFF